MGGTDIGGYGGSLEDIISDEDVGEYKRMADKLEKASYATLFGFLGGLAVAVGSIGLSFYSTNPEIGYVGGASAVSSLVLYLTSVVLHSNANDYKKEADYYKRLSKECGRW